MWWDDYMVFIPAVSDVVYLVVLWMKFLSKGKISNLLSARLSSHGVTHDMDS